MNLLSLVSASISCLCWWRSLTNLDKRGAMVILHCCPRKGLFCLSAVSSLTRPRLMWERGPTREKFGVHTLYTPLQLSPRPTTARASVVRLAQPACGALRYAGSFFFYEQHNNWKIKIVPLSPPQPHDPMTFFSPKQTEERGNTCRTIYRSLLL